MLTDHSVQQEDTRQDCRGQQGVAVAANSKGCPLSKRAAASNLVLHASPSSRCTTNLVTCEDEGGCLADDGGVVKPGGTAGTVARTQQQTKEAAAGAGGEGSGGGFMGW